MRRRKPLLSASTPIMYSQKHDHTKTESLNKVVLLKVSDCPLALQFLILSLSLSFPPVESSNCEPPSSAPHSKCSPCDMSEADTIVWFVVLRSRCL
jgi:hypothetical protein